jgi:dTDP-4-amino-4,6-dideoxygalactose transaminase
VWHLYVVRVTHRERLQLDLADAGIGTGIHYPVPLHLTKAYEDLGFSPGDFPVAERAAAEVLSLPMYPGLSAEQQQRVVTTMIASIQATADRSRELQSSATALGGG